MTVVKKKKQQKTERVSKRLGGNAGLGYEAMLRELILNAIKGAKGPGVALSEIINNAFDALCTQIKIKVGTFRGQPAIIIMDDGTGFGAKNVDSILSYFKSSKLRSDKGTMGLNGTGAKGMLGLGKLEKTKMTYLSFSDEYPEGLELWFDFDYLVKLGKGKAKGSDNVTLGIKADEFSQDWVRQKGTTVILTGFNIRNGNPGKLIEALTDRLTPRACAKTYVLNEDRYTLVPPKKITGTLLEFEDDTKHLGRISCHIYYGGDNDGPMICGPINAMMPLTKFYDTLDRATRAKVTKQWMSVGGYIYIENANEYRSHTNEFRDDFYEESIHEEFIDVLYVVAGELEKLNEKFAEDQDYRDKKGILEKISQVSQQLYQLPTEIQPGKMRPTTLSSLITDDDIFMVPRNLHMNPNGTITVTLNNKGKLPVDLKDVIWKSKNPKITISGKGQMVQFFAGNLEPTQTSVTCEVVAKGSFGEHSISVRIDRGHITPHIQGKTHIAPGSIEQYDLCRYGSPRVTWKITGSDQAVIVTHDGKSVEVNALQNAPNGSFILECWDNDEMIAFRSLKITDQKMADKALLTRIGGEIYIIDFSAHHQGCLAQIESNGPGEIPTIVINPVHPLIRKQGKFHSTNQILAAIANAGVTHQVAEGMITSTKANAIWSMYMNEIKGAIYPQK